MTTNRRLIPVVVASLAIVAVVVTVLTIAVIPFPEFSEPLAGEVEGRLAFVDQDNCIHVADLATVTATELFCESEGSFIEQLSWTEDGLAFVIYTNATVLRHIDPETGAVLSTETIDPVDGRELPRRIDSDLYMDKDGDTAVLRDGADIVLRLEAPDRYWIEYGAKRADGLYAFTDSQGRLAVFRANTTPVLVAEDVRSWGGFAWEPFSG